MRATALFFMIPTMAIVGIGLMGSQRASKSPAVKPKVASYAEQVAPILNKHCTSCHHDGAVAPFSLVGFENAKRNAASVVSAVNDKRMPPWKAVHGYGDFQDENRLTDEEITTLANWSQAGAPHGDPKKEPKAQVFNPDWELGKPDIVLTPSKPYTLGPEGQDVYRNFVFDLKNTEPVYVTAMDVKPGNKKIVHHVIGFLDSRGASTRLAAQNKDGQEGYTTTGGGIGTVPSGSIGGWAPGVAVKKAAPGTSFVIRPGTKIVMQVHYHKNGKDESDQTRLGLYTTKEKPKEENDIFWCANPAFRIPVGAAKHPVTWKQTIPGDATIYTVMPHMHLLGKSMKAKVIKDDGTEIPLVFVENWDFNWQLVYSLKQPLKVKQGWKIAVEAIYDNSDSNPYKTNHPVTWGEQTTDEMALLVIGYSSPNPIDLAGQFRQRVKDFLKGGSNP